LDGTDTTLAGQGHGTHFPPLIDVPSGSEEARAYTSASSFPSVSSQTKAAVPSSLFLP